MNELKNELGSTEEVGLKDLLLLPGVVRTEDSSNIDDDEIRPAAEQATNNALSQLVSMREEEGGNLEKDLRERTTRLADLLTLVKKHAPQAVEERHQRLDQRVRQLLGENQASLAPEDIPDPV